MEGSSFSVDWFYAVNKTKYGPWPLWDVFYNYSLPKVNSRLYENDESPATLGLATGTLFILALSTQTTSKNRKTLLASTQLFDQIFKLLASAVIVPILIILLSALALYRKIVESQIAGPLLSGADAVWSLDVDDAASRSVINVLALLDGDLDLQTLRTVVQYQLLPVSKKLTLLRQYSPFGYFYWKPVELDVKTMVRRLSGDDSREVSETELQARISSVCNAALPSNHAACWEVLLGPRVTQHDGPARTALIFRVHHSLGDGPALFRVLLSALADSSVMQPVISDKKLQRQVSPMSFVTDGLSGLAAHASLPPDVGPLHDKPLSGNKQVCWRTSQRLLEAARGIRAATKTSFTAGLLAALSAALQEYASRRGAVAPVLTVVVPARLPAQLNVASDELDNAFSMVLVQVRPTNTSTLDRLQEAERALREASTPSTVIMNSWALRLAGALLPRPLASRLLYSHQCTAVLSNMPGPASRVTFAGCPLSQLAFWVPHRGTTGVGATILSYAGQLTLGLILDEALLTSVEDGNKLIDAWERNVLKFYHELKFKNSV